MVALDPVIVWIVRAGIAVLFLGAAIPKLRDRAEFTATVENYRVVPAMLVAPIALALPLVELGLGFAPLVARPALVGAALVLGLYAAVVALNLARGRDHIDCGCHFLAQSGGTIDRAMVARNLLLAGAALVAGLVPATSRALGPVDILSVIAALVVTGLLYAAVEQARINYSRALQRAHGGA